MVNEQDEISKSNFLDNLCNLRSEITCCICLNIFEEPVNASCHHTFCLKCFKNLLTLTKNQNNLVLCPICKQELKRRSYTTNEQLRSAVIRFKEVNEEATRTWGYDFLDEKLYYEYMHTKMKKSKNKKPPSPTNLIPDDPFDALFTQNSNQPVFKRSSVRMMYKSKKPERLSQSLNNLDHQPNKNEQVHDWLEKNFNSDDSLNMTRLSPSRTVYVKQNSVMRKTKSLECIITKVKPRGRSHSNSNICRFPGETVSIIEEESPNMNCGFEQFHEKLSKEEQRMLDKMEEDCLKNFENEVFNLNQTEVKITNVVNVVDKENEDLTAKNINSVTSLLWNPEDSKASGSTGWTRMKQMKKDIRKKEKHFKKLNVSSSSVHESDKKKITPPSAKRASKRLQSKKLSTVKSSVYKLDQFESYLNQNLEKVTVTDTESSGRDTSPKVKNKLIKRVEENNKTDKSKTNKKMFDVTTHLTKPNSEKDVEVNNNPNGDLINILPLQNKTKQRTLKTYLKKDRKVEKSNENIPRISNVKSPMRNSQMLSSNSSISMAENPIKVLANPVSSIKNVINKKLKLMTKSSIDKFKQSEKNQKGARHLISNAENLEAKKSSPKNYVKKILGESDIMNRNESTYYCPTIDLEIDALKDRQIINNTESTDTDDKSQIISNQVSDIDNNNLNPKSTSSESKKRNISSCASDIENSIGNTTNIFIVNADVHKDATQNISDERTQALRQVLKEKAETFLQLSKSMLDTQDLFLLDKKMKSTRNFEQNASSLPNFSTESLLIENIKFYCTVIPYLKNFSDWRDKISPTKDPTSNHLTPLFDSNGKLIDALKENSENKKSQAPEMQDAAIQTEVNPQKQICDNEIQTDDIKCPQCHTIFNLMDCNKPTVPSTSNISVTQSTNKSVEIETINLISHHNKTISPENPQIVFVDNENFEVDLQETQSFQTIDNRVNRKLKFSPRRKYKRIRTCSSDSDSDTSIPKRLKSFKELNTYISNDVDVLFDSEMDVPESEMSQIIPKFKDSQRKKLYNASPGIDCDDYMNKFLAKLDMSNEKTLSSIEKSSSETMKSRDVTSKYISIIEKEYKEANLSKQNMNVTENEVRNTSYLTGQIKNNDNSIKNSVIDNLFLSNLNDSIKNNSLDLILSNNNDNVAANNQKSNKSLSNDIISASFSESPRTTNNKNVNSYKNKGMNESVSLSTVDPKEQDGIVDEETVIMTPFADDSFDAELQNSDILMDNVVNGTPMKDLANNRPQRSSNLSSLPNIKQIDPLSTEPLSADCYLEIAPPPEFRDSTEQPTANLTDFPDVIPESISLCGSLLNRQIQEELDDEKLTPLSCQTIEYEAPKTNRSFEVDKRNFNPFSIAQREKFSPLTIVKTNKPRLLCSTPKQKSILSYVTTPRKADKSWCSPNLNTSINLTPVKQKEVERKLCVACTRLNKEEVLTTVMFTTRFNGIYSKDFIPNVTHLVVMPNDRNCIQDQTIKYVSAVAFGAWIVSFAWVRDCLEHERLVSEEPYEVLDMSGVAGPKKSRLMHKSEPLFKNFEIHCAEPLQSATKQDVERIIIQLGGHVISAPEKLCKRKGIISLIITEAKISQQLERYQAWLETLGVISVDIEWLSQSVGQYQITSMHPYMLCLDEGIEDLGYPPSYIVPVPETQTLIEEYSMNSSHRKNV